MTWRRARSEDLERPAMSWFRLLTRTIGRRRSPSHVRTASFAVFCVDSSGA